MRVQHYDCVEADAEREDGSVLLAPCLIGTPWVLVEKGEFTFFLVTYANRKDDHTWVGSWWILPMKGRRLGPGGSPRFL